MKNRRLLILLATIIAVALTLTSCSLVDSLLGDAADDGDAVHEYKYTDFTDAEKAIFNESVGCVIPFIANDEYYVEGIKSEDDFSEGVNFYTFDNTAKDFADYRAELTDYELSDTYLDEDDDVWYCYEGNDVMIELSIYLRGTRTVVDIYVTSTVEAEPNEPDEPNEPNDPGEPNEPNDPGEPNEPNEPSEPNEPNEPGEPDDPDTPSIDGYKYNSFTDDEKAEMREIIGHVIPFLPNDEYYVDFYEAEEEYAATVNFYTFGNTEEDFEAYLSALSAYVLTDTYTDDYGDTCYCYEGLGAYIEISYYYYEEEWVVDVYACALEDSDDTNDPVIPDDPDEPSDPTAPSDPNGAKDVDLKNGRPVKDVTDLANYVDGCPTTGSPAVLVIPVDFSDITASSKGYSLSKLEAVFNGGTGSTDYYSVHDYYYISSYGQLDLDITVLDYWFRPQYSSSYYARQTMDFYGEDVMIGDQMVLDEALAYLESRMDLSKFDSDGNDIIDSVILVTTLDIADDDFHWAYRYWNLYVDENEYYYEYDGVSANDYIWAPYQFIFDDNNGNYNNTSITNPYIFIHEFAHVLGAEDYYDTAYVEHPMDGYDVMDDMSADHNPFTKFYLGWITETRIIATSTSVTVTLSDFTSSGDTIILANNWSDSLGAFQEYYIIVYYTNDGLNSGVGGLFDEEGLLVYHVNATLDSETDSDGTWYYLANNNTNASDKDYGTEDNLIEFVKSADGDYVYEAGETLPTVRDDNGKTLGYTFTVNSLDGSSATVTFTKK